MKKHISLALALLMCVSVFAGCKSDPKKDVVGGNYTYNSYTTALGTNWNPHTWETNADDSIRSYLSSPFCTMSILDSENGVYQWVYDMATSITDVTAANKGDLTKYNCILPEGQTADTTESGYVFEIKLNDKACWQDGTPINADTYIYSMQQLLAPEMKNYRANLYIDGESAVAGGKEYYYAGSTAYLDNYDGAATVKVASVDELVLGDDGNYNAADGSDVKIAVRVANSWLGGSSLGDYVDAYGSAYFDADAFAKLDGMADADGYAECNDETLALLTSVITAVADWGEDASCVVYYMMYGETYPEASYDSVGCYKVDDYTIHYVCRTSIDINYFLTSCTSTWLVYEPMYEAGKDTTGTLVTTDYMTSLENSISYGPYKMESLQDGKQIVFTQNEKWWGWEALDDGSLVSFTNYEVDGEVQQRYQTTRIVIDVMEESAAKQAFLKGELSSWSPSAEELTTYATSDQLYKVDETYTMSYFFNTDLDALKEMDNSKGNTNSVVLSNYNFRKAWSLAVDRAEYVTATPGYKPAYALMNNLYFYDVYNDPNSSYRGSEPAMQAVCNLYGVAYGDGAAYATLKDAYNSITGYNLTEAKALMKTACEELVADGIYTAGADIVIRIGWAKGALESSDNNQLALMNKYLNAAAEGSGFGKITLEAIGNIDNRYADVPAGEYAVGYGAWGGAAFYPFRNMQVYCDSTQYDLNEAACWDPAAEQLTLNVEGEDVTMSWAEWSNALIGTGKFAGSSNETKLEVTAQLEELYLEKYYRIPLCGTTICELLSYKNSYYTEDYNIMYGFGGLELMKYNYTDEEWTEFVSSQGGTLSYE